MLAACVALLLQLAPSEDGPVLYPADFTLYGPASRQTLLLEAHRGPNPRRRGQVNLQRPAAREDEAAREHVLELPHVARP